MRVALRIVWSACTQALRHPLVVLLCWLVVTVVALVVVLPVTRELDLALAHHPGASATLDLSLDPDFARQHPGTAIRTAAACLVVGLLFALLAGGILATVGRRRPLRMADLLGEGGRLLPRTVRVLAVTGLVLLVVQGGLDVLERWMREDWLYDVEPGSVSLPLIRDGVTMGLEAYDWLRGFAFLLVVFTGKIALARLVTTDRRSALLAWSVALGTVVRRPIRTATVVGTLVVAWLGVGHLFGEVTVRVLEGAHRPWVGLAVGQLGIVWTQVAIVASLLAARGMIEPEAAPSTPFVETTT